MFVSVIGRMPAAKHQHHQPYSNFSHREMIKYWKTLICCQHIHLLRRTRPNPILPRNLPDLTESIFQNHRLLEYKIPGVRLIFLIHNEKSSTIWYFAFCILHYCVLHYCVFGQIKRKDHQEAQSEIYLAIYLGISEAHSWPMSSCPNFFSPGKAK